jgi:DNA-binding MarR family transcriptional regulator
LAKELAKLFLALSVVRGKDAPGDDELRVMARAAEDSLPPNRLAVLRVLRTADGPLKVSQIAEATHLPRTTAAQTIEDLEVLGIAERGSGSNVELLWRLESKWKEKIGTLPFLR